jgi:hypothetical protein
VSAVDRLERLEITRETVLEIAEASDPGGSEPTLHASGRPCSDEPPLPVPCAGPHIQDTPDVALPPVEDPLSHAVQETCRYRGRLFTHPRKRQGFSTQETENCERRQPPFRKLPLKHKGRNAIPNKAALPLHQNSETFLPFR